MIAVECKAWAKNIEHDSMDRIGLAHFEVPAFRVIIISNVTFR